MLCFCFVFLLSSYGTAGSMIPLVLHFVRLRTCSAAPWQIYFWKLKTCCPCWRSSPSISKMSILLVSRPFLSFQLEILTKSDTSSIAGSLKCLQNIPYSISYMCKLLFCCRLVIYFQNEATWNLSLLFKKLPPIKIYGKRKEQICIYFF